MDFSPNRMPGHYRLVEKIGDVPARIERVDLANGRSEQVAILGPADAAGVVQISAVYAYTCFRYLSHLFVVGGVR